MPEPVHFFDLTPDDLRAFCAERGLAGFRAKQILEWVYRHGVVDPGEMTNLSKADRDVLADEMVFTRYTVIEHQRASDGTQKLLLSYGDPTAEIRSPKTEVECVMIPAESRDSGKVRRTACISSQVGCPVGCKFCASGLGGLDANLTRGLIAEQIYHLNQLTEPITNVVFMGMGEPLSNFGHVTAAIHTLAGNWGFGLSARRITLSTVGVPAQMRRLADQLDLPITLAISMHAPNDELRRQLIPWAESTSVQAIVDAGRYYFEQTGREVTLEYILLRGVNDRPEHAKELAGIAKQLRSNINLIRYNEVDGLPYQRPVSDDVHAFQQILREAGVNCHIRASRGRDIAAACGQLRHEQSTT